jgi:DNA polymerase-3 subunit alpha
MKLLFFDTETTGLPKNRDKAYKGPGNWPHIVSISWIIQDDGKIIQKKSFIIKPEWEIPSDSIKIHGITKERALKDGVDLNYVMDLFCNISYDYIIGHNIEFDINVVINACLWDLKKEMPKIGKQFCSMRNSVQIMKMPLGNGRHGWKSPKLNELYEFVTGKKPVSELLHSSMYDTELLVEIVDNFKPFRAILGLLVLNIEKVNVLEERTSILEL